MTSTTAVFHTLQILQTQMLCSILVGWLGVSALAQKPELAIQTGHSGNINAVTVSPNGRVIASGGVDRTVKIWEVESGLELRTLDGHSAAVQCLAFSPDGRWLVSGATDATIIFWEVATGRLAKSLKGHELAVTSLAFSADGRTLVSGGLDQTIRVWDVATGQQRHSLLTDDMAVYKGLVLLALSRDGRTIFSGGEIVKVWDAVTGRQLRILRERAVGKPQPDLALALSPDEKTLAIYGKGLNVLDVATGRIRWTASPTSGLESLVFSPDGKTLVGAGSEVIFWEAATGREIRTLTEISDFGKLAFNADGKYLALAGNSTRDFAIHWMDAATGQSIIKLIGHTSPITSIAFSADGRTLAAGRRTNIARTDTVKLWDTTTGQMLRTLNGNNLAVNDVAFSQDGRLLAGAGINIRIWNAASGQVERLINDNPRQADALAFSADGKTLASGDRNGSIKLFETTTGQATHLLNGHPRGVNAVAFSPDGKTLASGGYDKLVKLWDVATGQLLRTLSGHTDRVYAVAFSPDGKTLASGGLNQPVLWWETQTGQLLKTLPTFSNVRIDSLAFSPDGKSLAAAVIPLLNNTGGVLLWNVATGALLTHLKEAVNVSSVAYSPDGQILAAGTGESTVALWEAASGMFLANLLSLDEQDWIVVTPDGLFDGTPAAWSRILWRFSPQLADVAPVEVFFNEYFRPGLLSDLFNGKRPRAAVKLEQKDRRQPQLKLSVPGGAATRRVKVRLDITNAPAGAQDVRLFRNGGLVKVWRGDALRGQPGATLEADVPIAAGENRLTAYAFNRDNIKSLDATLTINGAEGLKRAGTAYLLAIGVNQYANAQFNLRFAVADATEFASELQRQQEKLKRYERIEVMALTDARATKAALLKALVDIAAQAQPEDAVIVYFAGHGMAYENQFYLIPHDLGYRGARNQITAADLNQVFARSLSDRELERAFETINAEQLLLVIDACQSGQALEAAEKRRGPMNSKGLAQLAYEKGMYVLTASQSYQAALEPADLQHGLLTYTLIEEGLKRAVADNEPKDGTIVMREWLDYAANRVPQLQRERMRQAGQRKLALAYVVDEERLLKVEQRNVQRPRVFYRRELEARPLVILGTAQKP